MSEDSPALRRRRLGARLRALREARHLTGEQAGQAIDRSASWISRIESGRMALRHRDMRDLLDLYGVADASIRDQFEELAGRAPQAWWGRYRTAIPEPYQILIGLEAEATEILIYENLVFPGLIQTEQYAEATFRHSTLAVTEQDIRDRTAVRMQRQQILRATPAPRLSIVIAESVINQTVGSRPVMLEQLARAADLAGAPTGGTELLVVPHERAMPTFSVVGFTVLRFAAPDRPTAYVENPTGGTIIEGESVAVYEQLFERLRDVASGPRLSRELIQRARERLQQPDAR
jgi:transcriptional regulator with XRE-family HTH domain